MTGNGDPCQTFAMAVFISPVWETARNYEDWPQNGWMNALVLE